MSSRLGDLYCRYCSVGDNRGNLSCSSTKHAAYRGRSGLAAGGGGWLGPGA